MTDPALSFGNVAESYHRGRPGYPAEAVAWLAGDAPATVLELGAGTGKLTHRLVEHGHDVHATDPDERMLAVLSRHLPEVRASVGTAEQIPAPDMTYDVVVAGQSFHWFDVGRALPEISRVLKPGGILALARNDRDESIPWVRKLGRLMEQPVRDDPTAALEESDHFAAVETTAYSFWQSIDRESVVDLVLSHSSLALLDEDERTAKRAEVLAFYDDYGRGMDGMQLPYVTRCYRATVTDRVPARPPTPPEPTAPASTTVISASVSAGLTDTAQRLPAILDADDGSDTGLLLIDFR